MYSQEVFSAIYDKRQYEYLIINRDLKIIEYSDKITKYYSDEKLFKNNMNFYSVVEEFYGCETQVEDLFNKKLKNIEIPSVSKGANKYIKISMEVGRREKGRIETLIVLFEDVSELINMHKHSLQDRNEKELLLMEVKKKNLKLLEYNEQMEELVEAEIKRNMQKEYLLIQQSKMATMGDMIANIAHQWRQPLNTLGLLNQALVIKYKLGEFDNNLIDKFNLNTRKQIGQMTRTVDDFINFFKPSRVKEIFDINKSIKHVNTLVSATLNHSNISLEFDKNKRHLSYGYPNEFSQVLLNLINNAKDALIENKSKNPTIVVDVYDDEESCIIKVSDNGGGVPKKYMEQIFDPYFTTKYDDKGIGIGLYMSKLIIETHMDGTLTLHNNDDGACFVIKLKLIS